LTPQDTAAVPDGSGEPYRNFSPEGLPDRSSSQSHLLTEQWITRSAMRTSHRAEFKATVVREILKEERTLSQIAASYEIPQIGPPDGGIKPWCKISEYFSFYTTRRLHQALDYQTPETGYLMKGASSTDKSRFFCLDNGRPLK